MGGGASKKQQASKQGPQATGTGACTAKAQEVPKPPPGPKATQEKRGANKVEDFIGTPSPPGSPEISPVGNSKAAPSASKISPKKGVSAASPKKGAWDDKSSACNTSTKVKKRPPELSLETPSEANRGMIDLDSPHSSEESFCVVDEMKRSPKKAGKTKKVNEEFSSVLPAQSNGSKTLQNPTIHASQQAGKATRITLFAGIMDNDRSARYTALQELCESLTQDDDGSVEPEFNLTMITEIMGLLMDSEFDVRSKAAETALNMARSESFSNITLEVVLERLYAMFQASQDTDEAADLCSGACIIIARALKEFLSRDAENTMWGSDIATSKVHLQAAIWDMTALVQRGLNDELSAAAKESASNLAVAVYLYLGVDESSNLIDGCSPSVIHNLFEKFADAEDSDAPISLTWQDTPAAFKCADVDLFNAHRSFEITANEESLMDDILEEVGLAFDDVNERLVRDKIICNASSGRAFAQSKLKKGPAALDDELAGLGLPDDLMQWTKTVLGDDNELS